MKRLVLIAAAALLVAQPAAVIAQTFDPAPVPNPVETLNFLGGSGVTSPLPWRVQVGPYEGSFASAPGTSFALYCVDYLHYASDSNGTVNATSLFAGSDLSNTRLQNFSAYRESAYLSSLFEGWGVHQTALEASEGTSFTQNHVWAGLHAAIWNVATGPTNLGDGDTRTVAAREYFLTDTDVASLPNGNAAYNGTGQEFLVRTPTTVPEPSTYLMMASGMLLLVGVGRRRMKEIAEQA